MFGVRCPVWRITESLPRRPFQLPRSVTGLTQDGRPHPVIVSRGGNTDWRRGGNTDTSTHKGVRAVLADLFRLAMTRCVIFLELAVLASALSRGDRWQRDEWRPWSGWSPCGRSCGGGMKYRERQCIPNRYDGVRTCMGQTRDYMMCNTQTCPGGTPDYRAEQCAKYNDEHLGGKKYKWIPFYGAANKCELNCMPEERNFFYRWEENVADGTHCEPGQRDVCVRGTCRAFGCNGQLGSDMAEDKCRVCGGDGSSCVPFISAFNKPEIPRGYNQILVIPAGATSIHIKEAVPSKNYLALKSPQGVYFLNGQWTIQYSQPLFVAGTVIHYIRDDQQHSIPQQLIAHGPTTEPLVVELLGLESNRGIHFEYYLPREAQLNTQKGIWSHGSWTECSAHCGEGVQTRTVYCTKDNEVTEDYFCSRAQPANIQNCNVHPCPHRMRLFHRHMPKKWPVEMCDEAASYRWHISAWGPCSASCGSGRKTRSVSCQLQASDHRHAEALDTSLCVTALGPRPHIEEQCSVHPCQNWVTGSWSECSAECGPGQQTRDVTCNDAQRCDERQHPARIRSCNNGPCVMAQWVPDSWSDCSVMCGEGTQTRRVYCGIRHGSGFEATQDYHCRGDQPAVTQRCQLAPCRETNSWFNGPWSQCSVSCGGGLHKRRIFCFSQEGAVEDESLCDAYTKPKDIDTCNMQPCPSPQGHGNKIPTQPHHCSETRFGCCPDSVTAALGPSFEGCRYQAGNGKPYACSLPYSAGSCNDWTAKWYSIPESKQCNLFWYGGCGGNDNRFESEEECLRACITGGGHSKEGSDNKEEHNVQNNSSINYSIRFVKTNGTVIHARPGQPIQLHCWSPSDSSATIDWTKDGYPVVDSRYKFFSNGALKISPVQQSDEGKYTCKVTTARGQKFVNIELRVKGNVWIKLLPADQEVDIYSQVEMPCTPSHEQASVQWTKNSLPVLSLPNKVEIRRDGTLVLMSVQPIDGGMYECTVQLGPNWDSAKAKLVVTPSRRTVFPHWAQRVRRSKHRQHKVMS